MAERRAVVSPSLIQKPPPLHEMNEDYLLDEGMDGRLVSRGIHNAVQCTRQ